MLDCKLFLVTQGPCFLNSIYTELISLFNVITVTDEDEVYAMVRNSSGCLGVGDSLSTLEPKEIEMLSKKKIKGTTLIL